jgi:surface antigen
MRSLWLAGAGLLVAAGLAGCAETRNLGSTIGGDAAALVKSVAGEPDDFLDRRVSKPLDEPARIAAAAAQLRALETAPAGTPVTWSEGHFFGTVTAGPRFALGGNDRCRAFSHTVYLDSRPRAVPGTACREPDGTWVRVAKPAQS